MRKEMHLAGGNADKIKESMDKTFRMRRAYVDLEKPALTDLLQVYPAMRLERELLNEFYRLTGVNAKEALLTLVRKYGQQILALTPRSSRHQADVEDPDNPYHCTVAVLMPVPRLVKEDPTAIISQLVPGESHAYPKLLHSADHPATSSALLVAFETLQLTTTGIIDGFALLLAVFWA
ncbi:uncharacterized protein LOC119406719 [Rhipicephalus sanguineus]|uniref:uncharacterized protein LOC119406719 n=1 Tax=Rhipicephalus sanguineus TaxID=34632 RepID=UPI0018936851|nr:uncharacterized protein LOC119406719 [Rhipicephalus sanguineus]